MDSGDGIGREVNAFASRLLQRVTMPARRNRSTARVSSSQPAAKRGGARRVPASTKAIKRWRRDVRPRALRSAVKATNALPWSASLLELLIEELYIDDSIEELLGDRLRDLPRRRYPQAMAVALILRHSWRADDLACIMERIGSKEPARRKK